jgi:hypothetical protein
MPTEAIHHLGKFFMIQDCKSVLTRSGLQIIPAHAYTPPAGYLGNRIIHF